MELIQAVKIPAIIKVFFIIEGMPSKRIEITPKIIIQVGSSDIPIKKNLTLQFKDENSNIFTGQTNSNGFLEKNLDIGKYQVTI